MANILIIRGVVLHYGTVHVSLRARGIARQRTAATRQPSDPLAHQALGVPEAAPPPLGEFTKAFLNSKVS